MSNNFELINNKFFRYYIALVLILMLVSCSDLDSEMGDDRRLTEQELSSIQKISATDNVYRFGFDLRTSPQEDARQYLPFLYYLERSTGYKFKLRFTSVGDNIANSLGSGKVQFAAVGAVSFIDAQHRYGVIALAHGLNRHGKSSYRSYIVVAPNSRLKTIQDLRGHQFAFGNETSTQGHLIPRIVLHKHGIGLADLEGYKFTGSHQNCADAVVAQQVDACGMQDTLAERLEKKGVVRILHRSEYFPSSGIAANRDVSPEVILKVKIALLKFDPTGKHAEELYSWGRTEMSNGFSAAEKNDYRYLEKWIEKLDLQGKD